MIKVGVSGAFGRMGRLTVASLEGEDDVLIHSLFAPNHGGAQVGGYTCSDDPADMMGADVIVEFAHLEGALANLPTWEATGAHLVVGTSGFSRERVDELAGNWGDSSARCLVVPNFALGAVLLLRFAEFAAPYFDAIEVTETHPPGKKDTPSGTAIAAAERIRSARDKVTGTERSGIADFGHADEAIDVIVHSLRIGGFGSRHQVTLGTPGQSLTLTHSVIDTEAFVSGIRLAVRGVGSLHLPVTVGLEALL